MGRREVVGERSQHGMMRWVHGAIDIQSGAFGGWALIRKQPRLRLQTGSRLPRESEDTLIPRIHDKPPGQVRV